MFWQSGLIMTVIDFIILISVVYLALVFHKHSQATEKLGLAVGIKIALLGLAVISLFYLADLFTMYLLPVLSSTEHAMAIMIDLHLNWSWLTALLSMLTLTAGLSYLVQVLIPKTTAAIEKRELAEDKVRKLNIDLERRVIDRTEAIRESEARFAGILDIATEAIISIDEAQRIILFNKGAKQIFGYTGNEVLGQPLDILLPKRFQKVHQNHIVEFNNSGIRAKPMLGRQDICGVRKNGEEFPAEASISRLELGGKIIFTTVLRDITEKKQKESQITESLREKEVLLKEVHHRVKNNLQIVSSLLNLQTGQVNDPQAREIFKGSQNRIKSMALIHENLYQSLDMSKVDLARYFEKLITNLFHSYNVNSNQVTLKTHVSNIFLPIDTAIPCGLIINELVSNSLKYAFPENRPGEIRVDVQPDSHDQLLIRVGDNGIGLDQNLDMQNTKTLGMQLVCTLSDQLRGTVKVENNGGTVFTITFPGPQPKGTHDHG